MNNTFVRRYVALLAALAGAFLMTGALCLPLQAQTNSRGEEFFIISSVDQKTHQVVLMRPTQLTVAANVGAQTICRTESGEKMSASALRAGDTVWAVLKGKSGAENLVSIREGAMTEAELQKLYLHYSASPLSTTPPASVKPSPLNPPPQSGTAQPPAPGPNATGSNAMLQRERRPGELHRHPHGPGGPAHNNP